jgi:hypothetical protein
MNTHETDVMTLKAECTTPSEGLQDRLASLRVQSPSLAARYVNISCRKPMEPQEEIGFVLQKKDYSIYG